MSARTGIQRGHQHEIGQEGKRHMRADDGDRAILQGLAKLCKYIAVELG